MELSICFVIGLILGTNALKTSLTAEDISSFLSWHNYYRSNVNPGASNMLKMVQNFNQAAFEN